MNPPVAALVSARGVLKRFCKAVLAPWYHAVRSGYFKSCLRGYAVDENGAALPMLTYPAIEFLLTLSPALRDANVLEFGSGQSTEWWKGRVARIVAVESHDPFLEIMARRYRDAENVEVVSYREFRESSDLRANKYDIVVIDGGPRIEAAREAPFLLKEGGLIIVDNSDIQSLGRIPEELHSKGFSRIDFIGISPCAFHAQATSFFFKDMLLLRSVSDVRPVSRHSLTHTLT